MENAPAVLEAIAIASLIASIAQERFLWRLEGQKAYVASVALSLAVGIVAVMRTGGFTITGDPTDVFGVAVSVMGAGIIALVASKAAFKILVRPISVK